MPLVLSIIIKSKIYTLRTLRSSVQMSGNLCERTMFNSGRLPAISAHIDIHTSNRRSRWNVQVQLLASIWFNQLEFCSIFLLCLWRYSAQLYINFINKWVQINSRENIKISYPSAAHSLRAQHFTIVYFPHTFKMTSLITTGRKSIFTCEPYRPNRP